MWGRAARGCGYVVFVVVRLVGLNHLVASFPFSHLLLLDFLHDDSLSRRLMVLILLRVIAVIMRSVWALWP